MLDRRRKDLRGGSSRSLFLKSSLLHGSLVGAVRRQTRSKYMYRVKISGLTKYRNIKRGFPIELGKSTVGNMLTVSMPRKVNFSTCSYYVLRRRF